MDKENNIMHMNPNKNVAQKYSLIKKLKTEKFSSFDRQKGIEPRIKKHVKTNLTDQEESSKSRNNPRVSALKQGFSFSFHSIEKQTRSIKS